MAQLMRQHDWASSSLGAVETWPDGLKVALRMLLTSRFEMWLGWGPDINFFYNDAYRPTLGLKHPASLGAPTRKLWAEIWDDIAPRIRKVYDEGVATWDRGLLLFLERGGYPEETYHTFSYSPLLGDTGKVEGLFCAVVEETEQVINERRMTTLRELAQSLSSAVTQEDVLAAVHSQLSDNSYDLPFTLTYLFDEKGIAELADTTNLVGGRTIAALTQPDDLHGIWPLSRIKAGEALIEVSLAEIPDLPTGAWDRPPSIAAVTPLWAGGNDQPAGFFVAAINPYRRFDDQYAGFIQLVAGQVAAKLASAHAYRG